jgi:hypothetical protein
MTITYRIEKGCPLSIEEVDNNFRELHKRIELLEQNQEGKLKWAGQVELQGTSLVFLNSAKEVISQVPLPLPHMYPRGRWQPRQSYVVYDLVSTGKQTHCCIKSHQSSDQFIADQEYWRILIDFEPEQERK